MDFRTLVKGYAQTPLFHHHLILDILKGYKRPNDKICELVKRGDLISVRRGLYLPGPSSPLSLPEPFLIANHLRGPSYVSLESALSYWGLIPERTFEVSSVTIKSSKTYRTQVGRYSYQYLPTPYYSYGIKSIDLSPKQAVLIASPEKAICDKIVSTSYVNLRSAKQTQKFLTEDLRIDRETLMNLDKKKVKSWVEHAPKQSSIQMFERTLYRL